MSKVRTNIVLVGFMGSGKSTTGRIVAKRLGFQLVDTDRLLVQRAGMEIAEVFAQRGESGFRDLETEVLESLRHYDRCVIATGGGVVIRERNRTLLRELGLVVLLKAGEDAIFERVSRNTKRPLLQTEDPRATVRAMMAERGPLYEAAAQVTIDNSVLSHDEVVAQVCGAARAAFGWSRV